MAKTRKRPKTTKRKPIARRKREWKDVTFEVLDSWREAQRIPKKTMAEMLGVTNSTYHNWARGVAVATPNTQTRILSVIGRAAPGAPQNGSSTHGASAEIMNATGEIVRCYLETKPPGLTVEKLVKLVREVRQALV
jgi:transcriptional regulator with XRE-family HTH domain